MTLVLFFSVGTSCVLPMYFGSSFPYNKVNFHKKKQTTAKGLKRRPVPHRPREDLDYYTQHDFQEVSESQQ